MADTNGTIPPTINGNGSGGSTSNGHTLSSQGHMRQLGGNEAQAAYVWGLIQDRLEQQRDITANLSTLSRQWLSQQSDPRRNLYDECGYPGDSTSVSTDLYRTLYDREPLATRVVELYPQECWQQTPTVFEDQDTSIVTPFEEAWDGIGRQLQGHNSWHQDESGSLVWEKLKRVDILSGIGSFGVLLIGIDDGKNLQEPIDGVMTVNDGPMLTDEEQALLNPQPRWGASDNFTTNQAGMGRGIPTKKDALGASPLNDAQRTTVNGWRQTRERDWVLNESGMYDRNQKLSVNSKVMVVDPKGRGSESLVTNVSADGCVRVGALPDVTFVRRGSVTHNQLVANGLLEEPVSNASEGFPGQRDRKDAPRDRGFHVDPKEPTGRARPLDPTKADSWNRPQHQGDPDEVFGTDRQYDDLGYGIGMPPPAASLGYSLSGTDEQYFGVQFGPSEQPAPPTEPGVFDDVTDDGDSVGGGPTDGGQQQRGARPPAGQGSSLHRRPRLLFLRAYDETLVQVVRYEWNIRNPRFGMPVMYRITLSDPRTMHSGVGLPMATVFVHWSRVIHVAEVSRSGGVSASEVFAVPRMQPCLNSILDSQKVCGAGAEGYWKSCFTGLQFTTHPQLGPDALVDVGGTKDQMEQFQNGLQRVLVGIGGQWSTIAPSVVDPTPHHTLAVEKICIVLGCPVRIFKGSERGELASGQDDESWNKRKSERQLNYMTPRLIVPLVDRLIQIDVLPQPGDAKNKVENVRRTQPWTRVRRTDSGWIVRNWRRGVLNAVPSSVENPQAAKDQQARTGQAGGKDAHSMGSITGRQQDMGPASSKRDVDQGAGPWETGQASSSPMPGQASATLFISDGGYSIEWPDVEAVNKKDKAAIAVQYTQALAAYQQSGCEALMPFKNYLVHVWGLDDELAQEMVDAAKQMHEEESTLGSPAMIDGHPVEPPDGSKDKADADAQAKAEEAKTDALKSGIPGASAGKMGMGGIPPAIGGGAAKPNPQDRKVAVTAKAQQKQKQQE